MTGCAAGQGHLPPPMPSPLIIVRWQCLAHVLRSISEVIETKVAENGPPIGVEGMASGSD